MIKRLQPSTLKRVITFPGQGQLISSSFISQLERSHDLTPFKASLSKQLSPEFTKSLFNLEQDPHFLMRTSNLQPAIVSISLLLLDLLRKNGVDDIKATYAIGHSLGELTALLVNGVFDPALGPVLARKRGEIMEQAINQKDGQKYGMVALLYGQESITDIIADTISDYSTVSVANQNLPTQLVLSGELTQINKAVQAIKDRLPKGSRIKAIPLKVEIPFHNPLLNETKQKFKDFVDQYPIDRLKKLQVPIISNLNGELVTTHGEALDTFIDCFTEPVLFSKSIQNILTNDPSTSDDKYEFINIGPNASVIQGLLRKLDQNGKIVQNSSVETMDDIALYAHSLSTTV